MNMENHFCDIRSLHAASYPFQQLYLTNSRTRVGAIETVDVTDTRPV